MIRPVRTPQPLRQNRPLEHHEHTEHTREHARPQTPLHPELLPTALFIVRIKNYTREMPAVKPTAVPGVGCLSGPPDKRPKPASQTAFAGHCFRYSLPAIQRHAPRRRSACRSARQPGPRAPIFSSHASPPCIPRSRNGSRTPPAQAPVDPSGRLAQEQEGLCRHLRLLGEIPVRDVTTPEGQPVRTHRNRWQESAGHVENNCNHVMRPRATILSTISVTARGICRRHPVALDLLAFPLPAVSALSHRKHQFLYCARHAPPARRFPTVSGCSPPPSASTASRLRPISCRPA